MTYKLAEMVLGRIHGPVLCMIDGKETAFANAQELLEHEFDRKYEVTCISARNDQIVVELRENRSVLNSLEENWAKEQFEKTGREISFF